MPLCPQVTMTPVPVTGTGITMNWVKPVVFPSTATASSLVGTLYQTTAPVAYIVGQLWADSSDGNKLYRCSAVATVINAVGSGSVVTFTTDAPHGFTVGQLVSIAEVDPTAYNLVGVTVASTPTTTSFTVSSTASGAYVDGGWAAGWTAVQDTSIAAAQSTATAAQSTANTAKSTADTAKSTADTAKSTADTALTNAATAQTTATNAATAASTAQTTANGKNTVTYSTSDPSGSGSRVGDIWWKYSGGNVVGYWTWNGSSWAAQSLDGSTAVITNIDAGKITTGTLSASIFIQGPVIRTGSSNPKLQMDTGGLYAWNAGGTQTFRVDTAGAVTASNINITGGPSGGDVINVGSGTFKVTSAGAVTATSATITGAVTATSGKVGNWSIVSGDYLTGTDGISLYATKSSGYHISASGIIYTGSYFEAPGGGTVFNTTGTSDATFSIGGAAGAVNAKWVPSVDDAYSLGGAAASRRWSVVYCKTGTINTSDAREKTDITDETLGLDFIKRLRPVGYRFIVGGNDVEKQYDDEGRVVGEVVTPRPGVRRHHGFLAQEVKATLDELNAEDFSGWTIADPNDPDSLQGLRYEAFIAPLVKAVQEQQAQLDAQAATIASLESRLAALEARL